MSKTILVVEDEQTQQIILEKFLLTQGYHVQVAGSGEEALSIMQEQEVGGSIGLVLLDIFLPKMNGLDVLAVLKEHSPDLPVIILTGERDIEQAVQAIKLGASDFINKPPNFAHLAVVIQNVLKASRLNKEVARLKRQEQGVTCFTDIVGYDSGLAASIRIASKAAHSLIPVAISGETGVGKELFARAIHGESERVGKPFIAVNCGAIPEHLIESLLFGHEKGAFTGATERTFGKFREAGGGTIFLDEVSELPLDAQVKLLRVLQQKEVEPVGSAKTVPVDVRVISATNRDLRQCVKEGTFREDLYYRLHVLPLEIPPLREHKEDITALVHYFIEKFSSVVKEFTPEAYDCLQKYSWPGNIRELQNVVERSLVLSQGNFVDESEVNYIFSQPDTSAVGGGKQPLSFSLLNNSGAIKTIDQIEAEAMQMVLDQCQHNITQAAKMLAMAKSTFYKKMKKYHIL